MSEKRFKLDFDNHSQGSIMDRQDKYGQYCRLYDFGEVGRQQIVNLLNEQQATIQSLKEENEQLRGINKEIGDDLYNCRLNKDIVSEKLKLWQDTLAEYDIYTIKDLYESFELDAKTSKEKDKKIKELEVKVLNLELEIKRLEKMIWKIQWRFQQEVGIEKAREHYREIDKEMKGVIEDE